jgi:hypothetical protein
MNETFFKNIKEAIYISTMLIIVYSVCVNLSNYLGKNEQTIAAISVIYAFLFSMFYLTSISSVVRDNKEIKIITTCFIGNLVFLKIKPKLP